MIARIGLGLLLPLLLLAASPDASAQPVPEARLKAIYAMSPEDMAATGAWTRSAYDRLLAHINGIKDKATRDLVLDMVLRPEAKVFKAKATQSYLASPAAGGKGHHYYPGGLPVHALEWVDVAMAWADAYEKIYKVKKIDRDMVIAALVLHDWAKVWYEWDSKTGKVVKPAWYPQSWGGEQGKAKWKWMGEHGAVVYAELYHRGAPEGLIVATAASHFDPHWDLDKDGEGLKDLGVAPGSLEANKLAWFVLSRVSDYRIYEVYQQAGFKMDAAKDLVVSILKDSAPYEVPKR